MQVAINITYADTDENKGDNKIKSLFSSVRGFHEMPNDYPKGCLPNKCNVDNPSGIWGRFQNGRKRWAEYKEGVKITLSLQVFSNKATSDWRGKMWTAEDLGGNSLHRFARSFQYAYEFLKHYEGIIEAVEIANEPWHENLGYDALNDWCRGWQSARQELPNSTIKIVGPAMRYGKAKYGIDSIFGLDIFGFDALNVHLYAFEEGFELTGIPESCSDFQHLEEVLAYQRQYAPHIPIHVSETGYDSKKVGELAQAAYNARTLLYLAQFKEVKYVAFYESVDAIGGKLYGSSGFIRNTGDKRKYGTEKPVFEAFKRLLPIVENATHESTTVEDGVYIQKWCGEKDDYIIAWIAEKIDAKTGLVFKTIETPVKFLKERIALHDSQGLQKKVKGKEITVSQMPIIYKIAQ